MASLYPLFVWPVFFAMWPRRKEVIELTSDGIRWQSPPRTIAATWDEVKGIRTTPLPGPAKHATIQTIETIRGDISYIPLAIDQNYILQRLIEKYRPADALVTSETDGPQTEPLAADSLTFTYRVPVNRAMLWLAFFEFGQPGFLGLLGIFGIFVPKGNTNPWSFLAFSSAAWLLCAYGWLAYYCSKVKLRDTGLEYTNAWSQTRIRWDEITAIGWTSYTSTIRTKDKTLRLGVLTDRSTLMNEIRRRAPQAEILDWPASESQN
jgi:hypothetical protein